MLSPAKCDALFMEPAGRFRKVWGANGWRMRGPDMSACWFDQGERFFRDAEAGINCKRNWYEGNNGQLGGQRRADQRLGLASLYEASTSGARLRRVHRLVLPAGGQQRARGTMRPGKCEHLVSLLARHIQQLRELRMAGVRGQRPVARQGGPERAEIKFAYEPRDLNTEDGPHPLGACNSYAPEGCDNGRGYGSSDVFFLEVCVYSTICNNSEDLFKLDVGETFRCNLSHEGFGRLKNWLLEPIPGEAVWESPRDDDDAD